jgi:hypothetical protein
MFLILRVMICPGSANTAHLIMEKERSGLIHSVFLMTGSIWQTAGKTLLMRMEE